MATATLVCKQCNFENEPERVYCHNCGAKLDRSLLPPEATRREDPVLVQERVRKMVSPRRGETLRQLKNLGTSLLIAVALAVVLLFISPPADEPNVSKEEAMNAPAITDDLDGFVNQAGAHRLIYKEEQVNGFLQYSVRGKDNNSWGVSLRFERAYMHFRDGQCSITSAQSIFGLPIYATTVRTVDVQNGVLVSRVIGGSFGRLRMPAFAMPHLEGVFGPLRKVLARDETLLAKLQSITVRRGIVELVSKPTPAGR